jgi:hypothetical protein
VGRREYASVLLDARPYPRIALPRQGPTGRAMSTIDEVMSWQGKTMVDADGDKIGTIEAIYPVIIVAASPPRT